MKINLTGQNTKKISIQGHPISIVFGLIILAYMLIPTFTPNLMAFDTAVPKFLTLALVNLLSFIFLLTQKEVRQQPGSLGFFFRTGVGLVYTGFLAASLLSFINAINPLEALLQLTKIFSVFSAVYILSVIFIHDLRYLKWVIIIFTGLLIFDALSVFYYINEFIQGRIGAITDIKTIYSNKNILASAIYVKLPFALWLLIFGKKWLRGLGWFGLMTGITATFFMATRAFYMGLILLSAVLLAYLLIVYLRRRQKEQIWLAGSYLVALILAYLAFTGTQHYLYPRGKDGSRLTQGVGQQLATVNLSDASLNARFQSWNWSWKLLKEKPLFGVGSGNWKVDILKYENKTKEDFTYLYKAHNDFIETAAETGFLGGLLYLGIFVLIGWAFLKQLFTAKNEEDDLFRCMFLAATGLAFYAVDAFFNFPADRPEIQVLFIFYVVAGISVIHHLKKKSGGEEPVQKSGYRNSRLIWPLTASAIIVLACISWIAGLNFKSSKTQRIAFQEIKSGKLQSKSDLIIAGFPFIPNLTIVGEPVGVQKARYLVNEGKNEQTLALLRADRASPWDGRREYFMAMGFYKLKRIDSALFYTEKLREIKPNYFLNIQLICSLLEERKEWGKAAKYLEAYLADNKNNSQAWVFASGFYDRNGNDEKAWQLIEDAKKYLPGDSLVEKQHNSLYKKIFEGPYIEDYNKAKEFFNKQDYSTALIYLNRYIGNVPANFIAHQLRAFIYYYQENYFQCIEEISYAITLSEDIGGRLVNLRGVCHYGINNLEAACKDFETAMIMGNKDGKTNYELYCKSKPQ